MFRNLIFIEFIYAQVNRLEEKEDVRRLTESELVHLRQEILLLGELQVKYKDKLEYNPTISTLKKEEMLLNQAFEQQILGT